MQLIIIVLAAFGLGFWFSRSQASQRLADATRNIGSRLRRSPNIDQAEAAKAGPETETA